MKKSEKAKKDREFSATIRSIGYCEKCGNTTTLQCCHIFSRRFVNMRWDERNVLCLCAKCHFWGHDNPLLFAEFVKDYKGEDIYNELIRLRNEVGK